jgi:phage baseplate assembly protein W
MFENIEPVELYGFKFQLANMVKMYEPRVNVNQIDITFGTTDIDMIIEYSIAALNTKDKITIKLERSR